MEQSDGAGKQYRNGINLKLNATISTKYQVNINKMITAPHHGKGDADSQGGIDKSEMKAKFHYPATFGVQEGGSRLVPATVGVDGKRISMAGLAMKVLSDPSRNTGKKGYGLKRRKREAQSKSSRRVYHHADTGMGDTLANSSLQLLNNPFKAVGWPSEKHLEYSVWSGMNGRYHFSTSPDLGPNLAAARRIPCCCHDCWTHLNRPWDHKLPANQHPRFETPPNCSLTAVLSGHNDWTILSLMQVKSAELQDEEIQELHEDILVGLEAEIASQIAPGTFEAYEYDVADDYYVVNWSSQVFPYTPDVGKVEGTQVVESGTAVVKGFYCQRVGRTRQWHIPSQPEVEHIFCVCYIALTGINMETTDEKRLPLGQIARRDRTKVLELNPMRISDESHEAILVEITRRARIDYEEDTEIIAACVSDEEEDDEYEADQDESESEEGKWFALYCFVRKVFSCGYSPL